MKRARVVAEHLKLEVTMLEVMSHGVLWALFDMINELTEIIFLREEKKS